MGLLSSVDTPLQPNGKRIRVLVADEHPVVCEGLSALLNRQPELEIVAWVRPAALIQDFDKVSPDITFLDFAPAPFEILPTVASLLEREPDAKFIAFTTSMCEEHVYTALQAGVKGYLHKSSLPSEILSCIEAISRGETWIPTPIRDVLTRRRAAFKLTKRERDVLSAMAAGQTNKEIGITLGMTEGTVKVHVTHILGKLKVSGRTEALATAAARGLVHFEATPKAAQQDNPEILARATAIVA